MALDISTLRPNSQTLSGYFLGAELFFGDPAHTLIARHLADIAAGGGGGLMPGSRGFQPWRPPLKVSRFINLGDERLCVE
jgi:hypothetical protein